MDDDTRTTTLDIAQRLGQPADGAHDGGLRINLAEATCCVRHEMLDGRARLVVPVVALNPGVLNDELVPASEVAASVLLWNDVPIPIEHPRERGMPISARTPAVLERALAGRLYGAVQGPDGKLRGEMWLDSAKMQAMGYGGLLELLEAGGPVEVSTAYFRDFESAPGELAGKPYVGIARNLRPDHLALLPHSKGACSWEDGCGAPRVNEAAGETGGMLALALPPEAAQALELFSDILPREADIVPASELHVTLAYLPNVAQLPLDEAQTMLATADAAKRFPVVFGRIGGVARFYADEGAGRYALVALLDSPALHSWRQMLLDTLPFGYFASQEHAFTPHITLAYIPADEKMPNIVPPALPIIFEKLTLAWRERRVAFELQGEALPLPMQDNAENSGSNRDAAGDVARTTANAARSVAIGAAPAEAQGPRKLGGKTVNEETKVEVEAEAEAKVETEPAVNELAGQLAVMAPLVALVAEFGGVAALREALSGLKTNADAERAGLLAELQANGRATFTPEELAGWPTATLRKLADALRPVDEGPAANYAGRGGPRGSVVDNEWQVLAAPEVK